MFFQLLKICCSFEVNPKYWDGGRAGWAVSGPELIWLHRDAPMGGQYNSHLLVSMSLLFPPLEYEQDLWLASNRGEESKWKDFTNVIKVLNRLTKLKHIRLHGPELITWACQEGLGFSEAETSHSKHSPIAAFEEANRYEFCSPKKWILFTTRGSLEVDPSLLELPDVNTEQLPPWFQLGVRLLTHIQYMVCL